jgi:V8-like Glu-specific endopeptidase
MKLYSLLFILNTAFAGPLAIYGEDNRKDVYAASSPYQQLALSTAAMIGRDEIKLSNGQATIGSKTLGSMYQLCPKERFRQQPISANCSGTLVAPDVIMTAGHCFDLPKQQCQDYVWVFDYKTSRENQSTVTVAESKIYECEKVIAKEFNGTMDFALVKLKRIVDDRQPARLHLKGELPVNSPLVMIGHPRGLPTKVTDGGYVLKAENTLYVTNLDAFTVNSGSGVFHAKTGEVIGILASGRNDYSMQDGCTSSIVYDMREGNEVVIKVDVLRNFL